MRAAIPEWKTAVGVLALWTLAGVGCKKEAAPQPIEPEAAPAPAPIALPDPEPEPGSRPPAPPTSGSWSALVRAVPRADVVAGIDLDLVRRSPLWAEQLDKIPLRSAEPLLAAAAHCGVSRDGVRRVVFATDREKPHAELIGLEAARLGEPATLNCIVDTAGIDAKWDGPTLVLTDDSFGRLFPLSPDAVVVYGLDWQAQVEAAIASERATPDPEISMLMQRTNTHLGAWAVGFLPASTGSLEHMRSFAVSAEGSAGLRIDAWIGVDPRHAEPVRSELEKQFQAMHGVFGGMGLSETMLRSVSFATVGDGVAVRLAFSEDDVRKVLQSMP